MRKVALLVAAAGLIAALAGAAPMASAADTLPACPPASASTGAPTHPAGPDAPGACRATGRVLESAVQRENATFTPAGYHHLGANTGGEWSGVSGRISVVDTTIRTGTWDFVAGRFMVKRNLGRGDIAWLEAGWAQTGWAGAGRPHVYTFNTNTKMWQFYDQYTLKPGDTAWLDLHSDATGVWGAWLWWGNRWNLLTAQKLPIGSTATVEQYVEVHVDASRPGRVDVPAVTVDNVRLRPADGGAPRFWREDVPTLTGADPMQQQRRGGFCLDWVTRYDTWRAGDCTDNERPPAGETPSAAPTPAPTAVEPAQAEVVSGLDGMPPASTAPTDLPRTPSGPAATDPGTEHGAPRSAPLATDPNPMPSGEPGIPPVTEPAPPTSTERPSLLGSLLGD